jgi:thioredoxin reductase
MGWEPVPANRHPAYMPKNMSDGVIERKGMVLMERPKEITEEVKTNEIKKARNQVRQQKQKIQQSADNQFERRGVKISTGYEPLEVPD